MHVQLIFTGQSAINKGNMGKLGVVLALTLLPICLSIETFEVNSEDEAIELNRVTKN